MNDNTKPGNCRFCGGKASPLLDNKYCHECAEFSERREPTKFKQYSGGKIPVVHDGKGNTWVA